MKSLFDWLNLRLTRLGARNMSRQRLMKAYEQSRLAAQQALDKVPESDFAVCIAPMLMALVWLGNYYPKMLFHEMQTLFDNQAAWLVPMFLFYTSLRVISAVGLWRNRMRGFWLALFVSAATLIMAPLLLPFTAVEMLLNGFLVAVLLIGFFGDKPIAAVDSES